MVGGDADGDGKSDLMVVERVPRFKGAQGPDVLARLVVALARINETKDPPESPVRFEVHVKSTGLPFSGPLDLNAPTGLNPDNSTWGCELSLQALWFIGDPNGDGKSDFIRVEERPTGQNWHPPGPNAWRNPNARLAWYNSLPQVVIRTAFSLGEGRFRFAPEYNTTFPWMRLWTPDPALLPAWLCSPPLHDRAHVGDFNGDGRTDLAFLNFEYVVNSQGNPSPYVAFHTFFSNGLGSYRRERFHVQIGNQRLSALTLAAARVQVTSLHNEPLMHPNAPMWQTGDFNGDGATDLMMAGPPSNQLEMTRWPAEISLVEFISDRKGKYSFNLRNTRTGWSLEDFCAVPNATPDPHGPCRRFQKFRLALDLFAGDINGDGRDDVMYAAPEDRINNVRTQLRADLSPNNLLDTRRWKSTDINGDGLLDLLYILYTNPGIRIYSSLGTTGSQRTAVPPQDPLPTFNDPNMNNWIAADVGGPDGQPDGKADLVHVGSEQDTLPSTGTRSFTLLAKGDGTWIPVERAESSWPMQDGTNWRAGDIDGDGRTDLVNTWVTDGHLELVTLFANGDGTWTRTSTPQGQIAGLSETEGRLWHEIDTKGDVQNWRVTDVNGDGRGDLVHIHRHPVHSQVQVIRTVLSAGRTGWHGITQTFLGGAEKWQVAELNGDGKADFVTAAIPDPLRLYPQQTTQPSSVIKVHELVSFGNGHWRAKTQWPFPNDPTKWVKVRAEANTPNWISLDANADGLTDLAHVSAPSTIHTLININGRHEWIDYRQTEIQPNGFSNILGWQAADWRAQGQDGLLLPELASSGKGIQLAYVKPGWRTPRMHVERNGIGLTNEIQYGTSAGSHALMPLGSPLTVVRGVTTRVLPGSTSAEVTYRYEGARWSFATRVSLGFARITASDGSRTIATDYAQTPGCVTLPKQTSIGEGTNLVQRTRYEYLDSSNSRGPPYTCTLSHRYVDDFQYTATPRTSRVSFKYDLYGNTTQTIDEGEFQDPNRNGIDDFPADNRTERQEYRPNLTSYIVGLPAETSLTDAAGKRVRWARLFYDKQENLAPPKLGDLTVSAAWDDRKARWIRTRYAYDSDGNRTQVTDPVGRTTTTGYDKTFDLFPVTECNRLFCTRQDWDSVLAKPKSTTDPNGDTTTFTYDQFGRDKRTSFPGGGCTENDYLDFGDPESQRILEQTCTTPNQELGSDKGLLVARRFDGQERTYRHERTGGLAKDLRYLGATPLVSSETTWHGQGQAPTTERYVYEMAGRRIRVTHEDDTYVEIRYGVGVQASLDELQHQKLQYTNVREQIVRVRERVTEQGQPRTHDTVYGYDALDRPTGVIDAQGHTSMTTWNSLGHQIGACDPDLGCRTFDYYDDGQLKVQIDAAGQRIGFTYDAIGRLKEKRYLGRGSTIRKRARWFYDVDPVTQARQGASLGRITRVDDPGRAAPIPPPRPLKVPSEITVKQHDHFWKIAQGMISKVLDRRSPRQRDIARYWVALAKANQKRLLPPYDPDVIYPGQRFQLPTLPSRPRATSPTQRGLDSSTRYWYDHRGNITQTHKCIARRCVTWKTLINVAGQLRKVVYPDSRGRISAASETVEDTYDAAGRLERVAATAPSPQVYVASLAYEANNRLEHMEYGNGTVTDYVYHPKRQWLSDIDVRAPSGGSLYKVGYVYDQAGRTDSISENNPNPMALKTTYDELGRLRTVRGSVTQDFEYDALGNITHNSRVGTYRYNDPKDIHAVTNAGNRRYRYDPNGNLRSAPGRTFAWNEDHLLTRVTYRRGTTTFNYDAAGERILKTGPKGRSTRYFGPYVEIDPKGKLTRNYYAGSKLVARRTTNHLRWYHQDLLGSTNLLTDRRGIAKERFNYEAFGTQVGPIPSPSTTSTPIGFTGHRHDETGLMYMHARYFDPVLARFISADTIVPDQMNPQALNRYSYAYNDPYGYVDPTGHVPRICGTVEVVGFGPPVTTCYDEPEPPPSESTKHFVWSQLLGTRDREERFRNDTLPGIYQRGRNKVYYPNVSGPGKRSQGQPTPISLQEAIYRGLGGTGPFVPGPRPTTDIDKLFIGVWVTYAVVVAGAYLTGTLAGALGTAGAGTEVALTSGQAGQLIGWGTGQSASAVAQTQAVTQTLTTATVRQLAARGLTRAWVEQQLTLYRAAALDPTKVAANAQLLPRMQLMERLLQFWP